MENKTVTIEVTEKELCHLINDLMDYCWKLKDKGLNKDHTWGYQSRQNLINKLEEISIREFPHCECAG